MMTTMKKSLRKRMTRTMTKNDPEHLFDLTNPLAYDPCTNLHRPTQQRRRRRTVLAIPSHTWHYQSPHINLCFDHSLFPGLLDFNSNQLLSLLFQHVDDQYYRHHPLLRRQTRLVSLVNNVYAIQISSKYPTYEKLLLGLDLCISCDRLLDLR